MINLGHIDDSALDPVTGAVIARVRVYYDTAWFDAHPQDPGSAPLVDGPRGYCLDITNNTGHNVRLEYSLGEGQVGTVSVAPGDPVASGPANGRSRTAAQMATAGYRVRGDITNVSINVV